MAINHATQQNDSVQSSQVAVVMVPLPAQGHLNQLLHLSRRISATNIAVYYVGAATHIRQARLRYFPESSPSSIPANIHFQEFPTTPFDNPPPDPNSPIKFPSQIVPSLTASTLLRRPIFDFVDGLSRTFRRVVVIYDCLMSYVVQDLDSIPNCEFYSFRSISAFAVCSWEAPSWPNIPCEAAILKETPSMDDYYSKEFAEFLDLQNGAKKIFSGEIYNSCREIEGYYIDLFAKTRMNEEIKIWALGPFNPVSIFHEKRVVLNNIVNHRRHKCLRWLDKQKPNSVIFVSFGTTCSFSDEQIREIAFGLERSGQKFMWALRDADKGNIFAGEVRETELPKGFEDRVRDRGIVVREWVPQLEILGHSSTGGFLSHCGWNSCMESLSMGVPVATWPMHSDQPANAVLMTRVLGTGVEMRRWSEELVTSARVEKVVRKLMASEEGGEMRRRAAELVEAVRRSVAGDGGAGRKEMEAFISHISR